MFEKYPALKVVLFIIACVGCYGGAVNYGGFDYLPAIPFIFFVIYAAALWRKFYLVVAIVLFLICTPLYILKKQHGPLFHPAIGKEFSFKQDMCLAPSGPDSVIASPVTEDRPCYQSKILPVKTILKISRISVSNADMGETYVIHAATPEGELYLSHNYDTAVWPNGEVIQQSDLRRLVFYAPSLMMYWPIFPFVLLNSVNR